ncbi:hypothetical protein Sde_2749 [Saccharophagus degradans 2-40]|uniref:Uncharacterized protein n=1 Tax=Saccharophagus degradans (strain 2-40 / ATCC 43961 / DSM 17024) TaxID=203122 RepID=Q21H20_SACD2|nr:hypothetical protein Sde_2749 [Saccharophagus degradans 2-40]
MFHFSIFTLYASDLDLTLLNYFKIKGGALLDSQTIDLSSFNTIELLRLQTKVIGELKGRSIVRTNNNPLADYAEYLAAKALGLELCVNSQTGHDGKDVHGLRYEVKARRVTTTNPSRQLSSIRKLNEKHFDWLLAIIFDEAFIVDQAILLPHEAIADYATHRDHTNSHILVMKGAVLKDQRLKDITERIRAAQLES